jgi:cardiolipin synthase
LLRDLRNAARRGVKVTLILQGEPDMPIAKLAARILYSYLLRAGVSIHEYCERPLHGKVALADDHWSTVGSSNLDPLSLSLNLEANLFVRDPGFAADLRQRLQRLLHDDCEAVERTRLPPWRPWHFLTRPLLFHCQRRFPAWAGLLPAHAPATTLLRPEAGETRS